MRDFVNVLYLPVSLSTNTSGIIGLIFRVLVGVEDSCLIENPRTFWYFEVQFWIRRFYPPEQGIQGFSPIFLPYILGLPAITVSQVVIE